MKIEYTNPSELAKRNKLRKEKLDYLLNSINKIITDPDEIASIDRDLANYGKAKMCFMSTQFEADILFREKK